MISKPIWFAIVIGVFLGGIGVSYAYFANTYDPMSMKFKNQELFDKMMSNNLKMSQYWMDSDMMNGQKIQDPNLMMEWMAKDPKHVEQMAKIMKEDHQFMSRMMSAMMNDPDLRLQMMGHMSENTEAFKEIMKMMGQTNMTGHMGHGMNQEMMHP